jgi:hypothetical protein
MTTPPPPVVTPAPCEALRDAFLLRWDVLQNGRRCAIFGGMALLVYVEPAAPPGVVRRVVAEVSWGARPVATRVWQLDAADDDAALWIAVAQLYAEAAADGYVARALASGQVRS